MISVVLFFLSETLSNKDNLRNGSRVYWDQRIFYNRNSIRVYLSHLTIQHLPAPISLHEYEAIQIPGDIYHIF